MKLPWTELGEGAGGTNFRRKMKSSVFDCIKVEMSIRPSNGDFH